MADIALVKEKVQNFLTAEGRLSIDTDGDFWVESGSTRTFVRISEHPNGDATTVFVMSPVLVRAPASPELFEYVATTDRWIFGRLVAVKRETGVDVLFSHMLLGDYLDKDELLYALYGVGAAADAMDEEMAAKFGGTTFTGQA